MHVSQKKLRATYPTGTKIDFVFFSHFPILFYNILFPFCVFFVVAYGPIYTFSTSSLRSHIHIFNQYRTHPKPQVSTDTVYGKVEALNKDRAVCRLPMKVSDTQFARGTQTTGNRLTVTHLRIV